MIRCIILIGPSAVGKTTTVGQLLATGKVRYGITCTTRPPREGEVNGVDYDFLTEAEYDHAVACGLMAEQTVYAGNPVKYGILCDRIFEANEAEEPTIWIVDPNGVWWFKEHYDAPGEVLVVALTADKETCRWRMVKRGNSEEEIARRLSTWEDELFVAIGLADVAIDTGHRTPEKVAASVLKRTGL